MIDVSMLDDDVLESICENMELDSGSESDMKIVEKLSVEEAFERFLTWNCISGFGNTIANALDNIRGAEKERDN